MLNLLHNTFASRCCFEAKHDMKMKITSAESKEKCAAFQLHLKCHYFASSNCVIIQCWFTMLKRKVSFVVAFVFNFYWKWVEREAKRDSRCLLIYGLKRTKWKETERLSWDTGTLFLCSLFSGCWRSLGNFQCVQRRESAVQRRTVQWKHQIN